jgi:hypothetical protein
MKLFIASFLVAVSILIGITGIYLLIDALLTIVDYKVILYVCAFVILWGGVSIALSGEVR